MSIYDKASLVLIPSGIKTSKVYSQKPVNGDGDFTFSRSTAATRVNADGNIEKETQNLLTYSNTFSSWSPTRGTLVQGVSDPFGGNDAWSLTATDHDPYLYNQTAWSGVATLSIWAKGVGSSIGKPIQLRMGGSFEEFTLTGDWQRFEKFTNGSASNIGIEVPNPAVAGDVVHIYGAQLEYGLVARDYIETTTTPVEGGITDNVPRLDYTDSSCPALLLEPQRTNVLARSEYFNTGPYNKINASVTSNDETSPEGVVNATKLISTGGASRVEAFPSVTDNTIYTASAFVKKGNVNFAMIGWRQKDGTGYSVFFNLLTGEIATINGSITPSIESVGDYYRISGTANVGSGTTTSFRLQYLIANTDGNVVTSSGDYIHIYGAQLEAGSYATSYIPTYGTSVTRNFDMASILPVSSSIIDTSKAHSGFIEIKSNGVDLSYQIFGIDDNSYNNFIKILQNSSQTNHRLYSRANGGGYLTSSYGTSGQYNKYAWTYDGAGTLKYFINGSLDSTHSATFPVMSNLGYGERSGATNYVAHSTNQILLFPSKLTDQEAIDLTTI